MSKLHQGQPVMITGRPLSKASAALVLLHGRGANAESILELTPYLEHPDFSYVAPQAAGFTWYPYSFMMPMEQNEPYLSSALDAVAGALAQVEAAGIQPEHIVIGGFSQGACLASEFVARHARRYGGLLVFSGGLIGPPGTPRTYDGSLDDTPVFVGCSDVDAHIPLARVEETAAVLERMGGVVDKQIYPRMAHTINQDELERAQRIVEQVGAAAAVRRV